MAFVKLVHHISIWWVCLSGPSTDSMLAYMGSFVISALDFDSHSHEVETVLTCICSAGAKLMVLKCMITLRKSAFWDNS